MSALGEKLIELLSKQYDLELLDLIKFWDEPASLKFLNEKIKNKLTKISDALSLDVEGWANKSLFQIKNELKNREEFKEILEYANSSLEEEIISDILIQCANPQDEKTSIFDELTFSNNLLENLETNSDLISKIESELEEYLECFQSIQ